MHVFILHGEPPTLAIGLTAQDLARLQAGEMLVSAPPTPDDDSRITIECIAGEAHATVRLNRDRA